MPIVECEIPRASALDRSLIDAASFREVYCVPLSHQPASVVDIFFGVFGHHPVWIKIILTIRNRMASYCGLEAPTAAEIMHPERKSSYDVGDKIGPWPIFHLTEIELIAGRNNRHLDFRLSVLKQEKDEVPRAVISTVCLTHNAFGRFYLFFVIPFHRWGMRRLLLRAMIVGRL